MRQLRSKWRSLLVFCPMHAAHSATLRPPQVLESCGHTAILIRPLCSEASPAASDAELPHSLVQMLVDAGRCESLESSSHSLCFVHGLQSQLQKSSKGKMDTSTPRRPVPWRFTCKSSYSASRTAGWHGDFSSRQISCPGTSTVRELLARVLAENSTSCQLPTCNRRTERPQTFKSSQASSVYCFGALHEVRVSSVPNLKQKQCFWSN